MSFNRVLVIANETVAGRKLIDTIKETAADGAEVKVVCPALSSRLKFMLSDVDGPRAAAQERLDRSLAMLEEAGVRASGEIGDGNPLRAFRDQSAIFEPDAVVVSTHPEGRSNWLENGVVEKIRAETDLPVSHVVVDIAAEAAEQKLKSA
ncbi:MAG: universal stress protein [Actinobacteria bacterium]|nr:universal stress protein [Actinomycetota bacterium]